MKKIMILAIFIALGLIEKVSAQSVNSFFYASGPNNPSYISQGSDTLLTETGWTFLKPKKAYFNKNSIYLEMVSKINPLNIKYWSISLQLPEDQPLKKGNYVGHRFPFQGKDYAGFDWSGNGRGLNTSTSYFNILEVEYSPDGKEVVKIAVDFIQFEETWNKVVLDKEIDRWGYGSYRYNSSLPISKKDIFSK